MTPRLKFGDLIILAICAALLCTAISGCALLSKSATADQKLADVRNLSYAAASIGAQEALLENPLWLPQFAQAEALLDQLVATRTITGALLRNVVAGLPVKELKSPRARIAVDQATLLFDATVGTSVNIEAQPYVLAAATGIRDGLKIALESGAPPPVPSIPFAPAIAQ